MKKSPTSRPRVRANVRPSVVIRASGVTGSGVIHLAVDTINIVVSVDIAPDSTINHHSC